MRCVDYNPHWTHLQKAFNDGATSKKSDWKDSSSISYSSYDTYIETTINVASPNISCSLTRKNGFSNLQINHKSNICTIMNVLSLFNVCKELKRDLISMDNLRDSTYKESFMKTDMGKITHNIFEKQINNLYIKFVFNVLSKYPSTSFFTSFNGWNLFGSFYPSQEIEVVEINIVHIISRLELLLEDASPRYGDIFK